MVRQERLPNSGHGKQSVTGGRRHAAWQVAAVVALGLAVAGCDKCTNLFGPAKTEAPAACVDEAPKR
jgi:hypothetical protein